MTTLYDQEQDLVAADDLADEFAAGMRKHCAQLAGALEILLNDPSNETLVLGRRTLDEFQAWSARIQASINAAEQARQ